MDSHHWASKIEIRRILSGKPDLKIKADTRATEDGPALQLMTLPPKSRSFFKQAVIDRRNS